MSIGDIEDPKEVNFITHPFLKHLEEEFEKDPGMAYTITRDGVPAAVVISSVAFDRMCEAMENARTEFE